MFTLFQNLTSNNTLCRNYPVSGSVQQFRRIEGVRVPMNQPVWIRLQRKNRHLPISPRGLELERRHALSMPQDDMRLMFIKLILQESARQNSSPFSDTESLYWDVVYTTSVTSWEPPFSKEHRATARFWEHGGLRLLLSKSARFLPFGLREALLYSMGINIRFSLVVTLMIGFGLWFAMSPDRVLYHICDVLSSPNQVFFRGILEDENFHRIFTTQILSPDCGEPVKEELHSILSDPPFDPLGSRSRVKGAAVGLACIVLSIAFAESISAQGILTYVY